MLELDETTDALIEQYIIVEGQRKQAQQGNEEENEQVEIQKEDKMVSETTDSATTNKIQHHSHDDTMNRQALSTPAATYPSILLEKHTCTNCGTTVSPVWRKGPLGPKSLCNACGLKWSLGKMPLDDKGSGGPKPTHPYTGPNYKIGCDGVPINIGTNEAAIEDLKEMSFVENQEEVVTMETAVSSPIFNATEVANTEQVLDQEVKTPKSRKRGSISQQQQQQQTPPSTQEEQLITPMRIKKHLKRARKICSNCGTTKTPVWRKGPLGTGTLCNACGLKFSLGTILLDPETGAVPGRPGFLELVSDTESEYEIDELAPGQTGKALLDKTLETSPKTRSRPPPTPNKSAKSRRKNRISRRKSISGQHQIMAIDSGLPSVSDLMFEEIFEPELSRKRAISKVDELALHGEVKRQKAELMESVRASLIGKVGSFVIPYPGAKSINHYLDSDTLLYIMMFIDEPATLATCMRVCRKWEKVVSDPRLWQFLYEKNWGINYANLNVYTKDVTATEHALDWKKLYQARSKLSMFTDIQQAEFMFKFYIIEDNPMILPCIMEKVSKEWQKHMARKKDKDVDTSGNAERKRLAIEGSESSRKMEE
jgi:hypothetical protein